jgi:acetolactate synthase small subunit
VAHKAGNRLAYKTLAYKRGATFHGNPVERSTLTVCGNDDPVLLIRVLGPVAAQAIPIESASISRGEDRALVRIVLVLRARRSVSEKIARRIERLVDVAEVRISPGE